MTTKKFAQLDNEGVIRRSLDLLPENVPVTVLPMMAVGKSIEPTDRPALDLIRDSTGG